MDDIRKYINLTESDQKPPFRENVQAAKFAMDRVLGSQDCTKKQKIIALRALAEDATRMANNIERWERDKERAEQERLANKEAPY